MTVAKMLSKPAAKDKRIAEGDARRICRARRAGEVPANALEALQDR
jgi:hypothetical protein